MRVLRLWSSLSCLLTLVSCGARSQPWRDASGAAVGSVTTTKLEDGRSDKRYTDDSGRVRRIETLSAAGACAEPVCAVVIDYDDQGRARERHFEDSRGQLVANASGYATVRIAWRDDGFDCTFFAPDGAATQRNDGAYRITVPFASSDRRTGPIEYRDLQDQLLRVRRSQYRANRLREISFRLPDGRLTEGLFHDLKAARVHYDYVHGATAAEIVVVHFLTVDDHTLTTSYYRENAPAIDPCR